MGRMGGMGGMGVLNLNLTPNLNLNPAVSVVLAMRRRDYD
jgi:hypothetical protein